MWIYQKKLEFPVNITNPDLRMAKALMAQYGGPYSELAAGRPVIVHLKNTTVSGVKRHANRTSTYEYHLTSSGWDAVNYPHIATSSTYGHWVCVAGISPTADPENLTESDFYALDTARVTANGRLAVTRLLDNTLWVENSPLKVLG